MFPSCCVLLFPANEGSNSVSSPFCLYQFPHRIPGGEIKHQPGYLKYTSSSSENPSKHSKRAEHTVACLSFPQSALQSNRLWGTALALGSWLLEPAKLHPWRPEAHQLLSSAYTSCHIHCIFTVLGGYLVLQEYKY